MLELNIRFMDLYKVVDCFIRDAYGSQQGVTEYLRLMEQNAFEGNRFVPTWKNDYDMLVRLRKIRNQFSHEVGFDVGICEVSDYHWLEDFKDRLFSASDPLAVLRKAKEKERYRQAQLRKQQSPTPVILQDRGPQPRKTLWQRIKAFFLG